MLHMQVFSEMQVIAEMGVGDVQRSGVKSWESMGAGPGQGSERSHPTSTADPS